MSDHAPSSQDFTELAKQTLVAQGLAPADALVHSAAKMLQRLADPITDLPLASSSSSSSLTHDDMLRRCASHAAA